MQTLKKIQTMLPSLTAKEKGELSHMLALQGSEPGSPEAEVEQLTLTYDALSLVSLNEYGVSQPSLRIVKRRWPSLVTALRTASGLIESWVALHPEASPGERLALRRYACRLWVCATMAWCGGITLFDLTRRSGRVAEALDQAFPGYAYTQACVSGVLRAIQSPGK